MAGVVAHLAESRQPRSSDFENLLFFAEATDFQFLLFRTPGLAHFEPYLSPSGSLVNEAISVVGNSGKMEYSVIAITRP